MTGLLRAEIRRFTSRRLMRVLAVAALALLILVLGRIAMISKVSTEQPFQPPASVVEQRLAQCEQAKAEGHFPEEFDCSRDFAGSEPFEVDQRVHARRALYEGVFAVSVAVALLAFVAAASFVGAEWHAGTMQALLFWEPRRGRVLFAKAAAVVAVSVAFLAVMQLVTYAGTFLIAATHGTTEGATAGVHMSVLLLALRGAVFVSVVALLAYAIAGLARITGAALGVAFVYFAIIENLVMGLRPGWERYLVTRNVSAILTKKIEVLPADMPRGGAAYFDSELFQHYTLTGVRGAITLTVYLAILLGAYYFVFTRRDVT